MPARRPKAPQRSPSPSAPSPRAGKAGTRARSRAHRRAAPPRSAAPAAALRGSRRESKRVPVPAVDGEHARGYAHEGAAEDSEADGARGPADQCADADARSGPAPEQRAGPGRLERRAGTGLHRGEHTKRKGELVTRESGSVEPAG